MKTAPLLLAASLTANVVCASLLLFRAPDRKPARPPPDGNLGPGADATEVPGAPASARPSASEAWNALRADSLTTFTANLRAAGLDERLVRAIVVATIDEHFRAREEALSPSRPALRYWQFDTYREPVETRMARLKLKREKTALRIDLLGTDADDVEADNPVPPGKWELAQMIAEDYGAQALLPGERALLETLEADRQKELAALLSPEELAEYEFRTSWFMQNLRRDLAHFESTEREFREIYRIRHEFHEQYQAGRSDFSLREGETEEQRRIRIESHMASYRAAEEQMEEDLRTALGEERYRTYRRETDGQRHLLRSLAERARLPMANAEQVFDQREELLREATRIGQDTAISSPETDRRHARTRQQVPHPHPRVARGRSWLGLSPRYR